MKNTSVQEVVAELLAYYQVNKRSMPWRNSGQDGQYDPYKIMVSEIMLQQTQVSRVIPKYEAFLTEFPDVATLAAAPLAAVISQWQGLGYNRRAKFLWQAAGMIMADYDGVFPDSTDQLQKLPGIGVNTAGAICAYAYDQPVVFIETNIRTVFIHHFFAGHDAVVDKQITPLVGEMLAAWQSVSGLGAREYYWALMDYGTFLKTSQGNSARRSTAYTKQSKFEGSRRQVRGAVLRHLTAGPSTVEQLNDIITDERLLSVCEELAGEGLITQQGTVLTLGG